MPMSMVLMGKPSAVCWTFASVSNLSPGSDYSASEAVWSDFSVMYGKRTGVFVTFYRTGVNPGTPVVAAPSRMSVWAVRQYNETSFQIKSCTWKIP
jgi:hypothetical protein